jgi:hypothetical protein
MKIVINGRFGGFGLSLAGHEEIARRNGGHDISWDMERNNPDLVEMIEENASLYGDKYSELYVVEIPDAVEWYIHDYDGIEHVAEKHRTWR